MFNTAKIEPNDACYYQKKAEYLYQGQRFFEIEHADEGDQRGTDSGPDSIGDADVYFFECEGQTHKRKTVKYKNQYRWN